MRYGRVSQDFLFTVSVLGRVIQARVSSEGILSVYFGDGGKRNLFVSLLYANVTVTYETSDKKLLCISLTEWSRHRNEHK